MSYKPPTRAEIEKWTCLATEVAWHPDIKFLRVVFCAPKGYANRYPWKTGDTLLYMGQMHNMGGHGVFVDKESKTYWGFHTDSFYVEPDEDAMGDLPE